MKIILVLANGKQVVITSKNELLINDVLSELLKSIPLNQIWRNSYSGVCVKFYDYNLNYLNLSKVVGISIKGSKREKKRRGIKIKRR